MSAFLFNLKYDVHFCKVERSTQLMYSIHCIMVDFLPCHGKDFVLVHWLLCISDTIAIRQYKKSMHLFECFLFEYPMAIMFLFEVFFTQNENMICSSHRSAALSICSLCFVFLYCVLYRSY